MLELDSHFPGNREICGTICNCGPNGEPLACGYLMKHEGNHSWATLPTFHVAWVLTDQQKSAKDTARLLARTLWWKHVNTAVARLAKMEEIGDTQASAYLAEALREFCVVAEEAWNKTR